MARLENVAFPSGSVESRTTEGPYVLVAKGEGQYNLHLLDRSQDGPPMVLMPILLTGTIDQCRKAIDAVQGGL